MRLMLGCILCGTFSSALASSLGVLNDLDEEVVSAVECKIKDPGYLTRFLAIQAGARIRVETLSTNTSTLLVEGEAYYTGFPAVLNFKPRTNSFVFSGTEDSEDQKTSVSIVLSGELGLRSEGEFYFLYQEGNVDILGVATLRSCFRKN